MKPLKKGLGEQLNLEWSHNDAAIILVRVDESHCGPYEAVFCEARMLHQGPEPLMSDGTPILLVAVFPTAGCRLNQ